MAEKQVIAEYTGRKVIDTDAILRAVGVIAPQYWNNGKQKPLPSLEHVVGTLHSKGINTRICTGRVTEISEPSRYLVISLDYCTVIGEAPDGSYFSLESKNPGYYDSDVRTHLY